MKVFIILCNTGFYFTLPCVIGTQEFPKSLYSLKHNATQFPFFAAAERTIKKYKLKNSEIQTIEI